MGLNRGGRKGSQDAYCRLASLVSIGAGVERGSANEVQSLFADLLAALGIALDNALGLADWGGRFSGEAGGVWQVANLATCSVPPVLGLGVQLFIDRLAPRRLPGAISGVQFSGT